MGEQAHWGHHRPLHPEAGGEGGAGCPKTERKEIFQKEMFQRPQGMTNITQLYTAAFNQEKGGELASKVKPTRSGNIAKLYTGALDKEPEKAFKGKPKDERTNPTKHNLATTVDKRAIVDAPCG